MLTDEPYFEFWSYVAALASALTTPIIFNLQNYGNYTPWWVAASGEVWLLSVVIMVTFGFLLALGEINYS